MNKASKIYVAGHRGTAGSAILKRLQTLGYTNLVFKTHDELNLTNNIAVEEFFEKEKPEYIFFAAAKLGHLGMQMPAELFYQNLTMQNNIFHNAYLYDVKKLIFFGSSWMYPQSAENPIKEEYLLTDELEYNAESYALPKITGIKMCEAYNLQYNTNFLSVALTNLYGETKDFDFKTAKVLPAMLRKFHLAKLLNEKQYDNILKDLNMDTIKSSVEYLNKNGIYENHIEIWGSGNTRREFIHSQDLADACIFIMNNVDFSHLYDKDVKQIKNTHINVGTGQDLSIKDLAYLINDIVGFKGEIKFDTSKPDSPMNRLLDCSKIHSLGWKHKIELEDGIKNMYKWYLEQIKG